MATLAPIVLFTYKRLDTLKQTVATLQLNYLALESDLYVFSDAAKGEQDFEMVSNVRNFLKTITGFKSIIIYESPVNNGLASSIIKGVSEILKKNETAIVIEDDLVSSPNFLNYMNDSLNFYRDNNKVFSIGGYSIPIKKGKSSSDIYFTSRATCWGWATWRDRWSIIDWEVKDYSEFKNNKGLRRSFNKMGSDMANMLEKQMNGKINSWAIRWCYHQFKSNLLSVHPFVSKIENIGFNSANASNTKERFNRFKTKLDNGEKTNFLFSEEFLLDQKIIQQYTKPVSLTTRIKYKLLNLILSY